MRSSGRRIYSKPTRWGCRLNNMETDNEKKYDNKYLLERQLEMIKIFYERKLLTKEQYEFEVKTLTTRIKTNEGKES